MNIRGLRQLVLAPCVGLLLLACDPPTPPAPPPVTPPAVSAKPAKPSPATPAKPAPAAPALGPSNFIGTWQLTLTGYAAPVNMVLRRSATKGSAGSLELDGRFGAGNIVTGSATGGVFVGTIVYGNNATAIEMRLVTPTQAQGSYSSGMNARPLVGVKMP